MMQVPATVAETESAGEWVDLQAAWVERYEAADKLSLTLAQLVIPANYDQATVTIEIAENDQGTDGAKLVDVDGNDVSVITVPGDLPARVTLNPALFAYCKAARVVLPSAAGDTFEFAFCIRAAR